MNTALDLFGAGLVTVFNGAWAMVTAVLSPVTLAVIAGAAGMVWLAGIEVEELNRQGTKPDIQLH